MSLANVAVHALMLVCACLLHHGQRTHHLQLLVSVLVANMILQRLRQKT